ncbi:LysR family transcriptional regulator [Burkholderia alba]|uniref:LysR family transcriptional regulator n=1 Tax=Burkholderia alba TaxID=2683677 RepID=UPI002B062742|nr:LysR family transcriptional regulator [Burkholderia alba]
MAMRVFVKVAELGSFVRAAGYIGISRAVATRHVVALENRLGARLIYRTTRRLSLTEAGSKYLLSAKQLLDDLDLAEQEVSLRSRGPIGTLRIVVAPGFGQRYIIPLLPSFMETFPNIVPDVTFLGRKIDLVDEGFDAGVVIIQQVRHGSTVTRHLTDVQMIACASPRYLENHGTPDHPSDLAKQSCLALPATCWGRDEYEFSHDKDLIRLKLTSTVMTDSVEVIHRLALLGVGVAILPDYIASPDIASGALKRVLNEYELSNTEVHVAYPNRRHLPIKVRLFVDYLFENIDTKQSRGESC